ncbi:RNA exonuclease 5 isoform X2 [Rhineura floridana]|uniref:RNA exonuclease 5 isoform X2 n=1 Tax=Rhineura floridana TaxID=261503 RepID=UPI002AC83E52|nr:RNA exonuclease 5 isoform X2 [Rhineura floridana]
MAAATQVMKQKRSCEDDENVEETQKVKKKRKVAENDIWENQQKAKILSEKKKPHLSAAVFGEDCEISYDQLYQFLKYAALGKRHDAAQPSWCRIHHRRRLAGVAVVVLCGVSQLHFDRFYMQFKNLRKTFKHRFCLPPSSDGFMEKLCGAGINDNPQISRQVTQKDPIIQKYGEERHGLSRYVLTLEEMHLNDYPLEDVSNCSHFVCTHGQGPVMDSSPLFGLDCEMCLTDKGSELARISVVDASGQCIMNELVRPKLPIRNYLTSYSGITEELLLPVTTTLADVQVQLKKLLPAHAVLVGHSLNFDLRALEMVHPNVIDTSLLFARKGGKRFKLKFLAKAVLGKQIQPTDGKGHDPTEDAKCALELAQYFINQGPRKVAELNLEARLQQERETGNRQNCPLPHQENGVRKPTQSLLDILCSVGQKTFFLGGQSEAASYNCQNHISSLNKQVLQRALEEIPRSSFSVIQLCLGLQQDTPHQVAETVSKMRTKLANMLTVYAGPFGKDACLKSLKRTFKKYGHVLSISAIAETCEPHICVQYEVLEAAQLAMESLNGEEVAGSLIKLQRPITEVTLDCEMLVKELERDADNEGVLYLSGLGKTQSETDLREKLGYLKDLNAVFVPRDPRTGKRRNYCFLKFQTPESVRRALKTIEEERDRGSKLQSRMALTPARLHKWFCHVTQNGGKLAVSQPLLKAPFPEKKKTFALEQDLKKAMKAFDHRIKKLYQGLPDHMLCVILLPGTNRVSESLHGFGLLGIKGDNPPLEAPNCNHSF